MFTGLVAETGTVRTIEPLGGAGGPAGQGGARLEVASRLAAELERGDSIAVSGVCLTATEVRPDRFAADLMGETLGRSSLGSLSAGARVNLELPLRAGDRLGGHFMQGHVDGLGTVESVIGEGLARRLAISTGEELTRYVADKGSVAVDGVSLTAIAPGEGSFEVALVPETIERTTLGELTRGRQVNLELDLLAKYVDRLIARADGKLAPLTGGAG